MALQTVQEHENHAAASEDWQSTKSQATGSSRRSHSQAESYAAPNSLVGKMKGFRIEFGPSRKDILHFTSQLAVMVRAGISLQDALEGICEQSDNAKFQGVLRDLKLRIEEGNSFSQALAEHPQVFTNLYVNMVAAAEASGSSATCSRSWPSTWTRKRRHARRSKGPWVSCHHCRHGHRRHDISAVLRAAAFHRHLPGQGASSSAPTIVLMATSHFCGRGGILSSR